MAERFELDDHGNCSACGNLSIESEHVKCFTCKKLFHVVCKNSTADETVATKTLIENFLGSSTKKNFPFFFDKCVTLLEISSSESDSQRINLLETKMSTIDSQLKEISMMLKAKGESKADAPTKPVKSPEKKSIWNDTEKLATVKAPPSTAVLVLPKIPNQETHSANKTIIEKTVIDNQIPLKETYTNREGDLVLVCESTEKRDELKTLVQTVKQDIKMNTPKPKQHSITIVGMAREYSTEEIKKMIVQQNVLMKRFTEANNLDDHLKVHSVKSLKSDDQKFQVFASVSETLREGFKKSKDKVIMGVTSCKVYDRVQTKRCNNCQMFGHFMANCPTASTPACGKCSGDHATKDCTETTRGCINCKRSNTEYLSHSAFYHKCPSLLRFQELVEESKSVDSLNSERRQEGVKR